MSTDKLADAIAADDGYMDHYAEAAAARIREAFVVIDRNDLPDVQGAFSDGSRRAEHKDANGTWWGGATPEFLHGRALEILALAENLRANPPVDEKAVRELAAAIDSAFVPEANKALFTAASRDEAARRLVADGWKREVTP